MTRKELDEKKLRELAHQEAIRSQIEERERLKLLKKQQKILQVCRSALVVIAMRTVARSCAA